MSHAARTAEAMERDEQRREAQPDLFVQERLAALRARVEAVAAARDEAQRKVNCAPHGTYKARLQAFGDLTHQLLQLESELRRAEREAGR